MNKRLQLQVFGCVQGVGFRPFVYRLAKLHSLAGFVANTNQGVCIEVQGREDELEQFQHNLIRSKPGQAVIKDIVSAQLPLQKEDVFAIKESRSLGSTTLALLPDTAICSLCVKELFDPKNRRYLYPFIHCTCCGPRFSLFERMPFDRENTAMKDFPPCAKCSQEYSDPADRRFYSQTTCCPECGPKLQLLDSKNALLAEGKSAIDHAAVALKAGKIVALKNTGGYLLCVDGTNEMAVQSLRIRKKRLRKPFALLMENLAQVEQYAILTPAAAQALTSSAAPIVLLEKLREPAPSIGYDTPYHGIMVAHSALQLLLLKKVASPLVATSGNLSDLPLCITEEQAFEQLSSVADLFLIHNRRIVHRLDDSIVHLIADQPTVLRRGRGLIPDALVSPKSCKEPLLAAGGHQKSSFALHTNGHIYLSQHLGDLDSLEACVAYNEEISAWERLMHCTPSEGIADRHPGYYTSHYVQKRFTECSWVQHHEAHALSCMLDNRLCETDAPLLCFSWDGTGWGETQSIWGGEAFLIKGAARARYATLYPFRLPGADKAVREPRRTALGALYTLFEGNDGTDLAGAFRPEEYALISTALAKGINSPLCNSMGRLFDAAAALLGLCLINSFEGEAALALEACALKAKATCPLNYTIVLTQENDLWIFDWRPLFLRLIEDKKKGTAQETLSLAFHHALAMSIVELALSSPAKKILLTGGVMHNKLLVEMVVAGLREVGLEPFWHHQIPPGDGGIAAGQIMGKILCV